MNTNRKPIMPMVIEYINEGYDSLTDLYTCRPSDLAATISKRGFSDKYPTPGLSRWCALKLETIAVVTSELEFIGYLKGRMLEAQMEWENKDTAETSYTFLYYYNALVEEVFNKLLDEKYLYSDKYISVNWQGNIERYLKQDMEAVANLLEDNLEMYYDRQKKKWVACVPSGDLVSIYDKQEGESIV